MDYLQYVFKGFVPLFIALISVVTMVGLVICYMADSYIIFLVICIVYFSLLASCLFGQWLKYSRYKNDQYNYKMRLMHKDNKGDYYDPTC
jgi:uncharacterized membrane protein YqjE